MARGYTLGSTGWIPGQQYLFRVEYSATSLKVYVDGVLEIDITGNFNDGRFAFYNFSQDQVTYSHLTVAVSVGIDIRWRRDPNQIFIRNGRLSPHLLRVAILSTEDFDAPELVDEASLTFGRTGDEESLEFCANLAGDVNRDGYADLLCYFRTSMTGFQLGDTEGILKGLTMDGEAIEGHDAIEVIER